VLCQQQLDVRAGQLSRWASHEQREPKQVHVNAAQNMKFPVDRNLAINPQNTLPGLN
jgi:hypothetical protein